MSIKEKRTELKERVAALFHRIGSTHREIRVGSATPAKLEALVKLVDEHDETWTAYTRLLMEDAEASVRREMIR